MLHVLVQLAAAKSKICWAHIAALAVRALQLALWVIAAENSVLLSSKLDDTHCSCRSAESSEATTEPCGRLVALSA